MKKIYFLLLIISFSAANLKGAVPDTAYFLNNYSKLADRIIAEIMKDSSAWDRLAYMCDVFGPRLSGSEGLEKSIEWVYEKMKKDGLENVRKEEVMVPYWKRGKEHCRLVSPRIEEFPVLGLGGSVSTPPEGITAPVLVVNSFEDLDNRSDEAKGKIVVFNYEYEHYGQAVQYRVWGADAASKYGAAASLIKSVSPEGFKLPHTGMMRYSDTLKKIPHAAISHEDCRLLQRLQDYGQNPEVTLYMGAETLPDVLSYNVICELRGTEKPEEIVALGGHFDCWDTGSGAHDDASGCISAWHVLKILKDMGLRPKRTLRAVMWANEENGVRGGKAYAEDHKEEPHALLFEWDSGVFPPNQIRFNGPEQIFGIICSYMPVLNKIHPMEAINAGWVGVDISPMMRQNHVPGMALNTDDKGEYFLYHHSPLDTPDHVDPYEFNQCIAAIALAVYIFADLPVDVMQYRHGTN